MSEEPQYQHHGDNVEVPIEKSKSKSFLQDKDLHEDIIYWVAITYVVIVFLIRPILDFYRSLNQ